MDESHPTAEAGRARPSLFLRLFLRLFFSPLPLPPLSSSSSSSSPPPPPLPRRQALRNRNRLSTRSSEARSSRPASSAASARGSSSLPSSPPSCLPNPGRGGDRRGGGPAPAPDPDAAAPAPPPAPVFGRSFSPPDPPRPLLREGGSGPAMRGDSARLVSPPPASPSSAVGQPPCCCRTLMSLARCTCASTITRVFLCWWMIDLFHINTDLELTAAPDRLCIAKSYCTSTQVL